MKLRTRLILVYLILACTASAVIAAVSTISENSRYRREQIALVKEQALLVTDSVDTLVSMMGQTMEQFLSDNEVLNSLHIIGNEEEDTYSFNENRQVVTSALSNSYNYENFYRVIVFNDRRFIASSVSSQDRVVNTGKDPSEIRWLSGLRGSRGAEYLIGIHEDDWAPAGRGRRVFSLVKEIQGNNMGYIEVQETEEFLKEKLSSVESNTDIVLTSSEGEVLYTTEGLEEEEYLPLLDKADDTFIQKVSGKNQQIVSIRTSDKTGNRIILLSSLAKNAASSRLFATLLPTFLFLAGSVIFVLLSSSVLTRPLYDLRRTMENTNLDNMTEPVKVESDDEDINALALAYEKLMNRLKAEQEKEKNLSIMQMQAQFDMLQAQINPHFLYNVLNTLSSRGLDDDDEVICEICGHLGTMLRYATNNKVRIVRLADEVAYLQDYIYLLKARYEDRLEVSVEIDPCLDEIQVPKVLLQQFVENSVSHGYVNRSAVMHLQVRGRKTDDGWEIHVLDDGAGIADDRKQQITEDIEKLKQQINRQDESIQFSIGGMGLANTFGRMYLLYGEQMIFDLHNRRDASGMEAVIGVRKNVHGTDR